MVTNTARSLAGQDGQVRRARRLVVTALAGSLALAGACDDTAEEAADPPTTVAGDVAADPSGGARRECSPVGAELESQADETVAVSLDEYSFDPTPIEVRAGTVTFEARNAGGEEHELAFLPGGGDVPLTEDGAPDEEALAEAGAFELEAFELGQTRNATYVLEPGAYTLFCIVEAPDGETHVSKGMRGQLVVE